VFANVTNDMTIAKEEIFGPVVSILGYSSVDEAVQVGNDTEYGLAAYVSGTDPAKVREVASKLRAGQVNLNGAAPDMMAPFGGFKMSGNGREWGDHAFQRVPGGEGGARLRRAAAGGGVARGVIPGARRRDRDPTGVGIARAGGPALAALRPGWTKSCTEPLDDPHGRDFRRSRRAAADEAAFTFEGRTTTFAEVESLSNQWANALIAAGVQPGERVAILSKNHDVFFRCGWGAQRRGRVLRP
jgi:hypothetical protein